MKSHLRKLSKMAKLVFVLIHPIKMNSRKSYDISLITSLGDMDESANPRAS